MSLLSKQEQLRQLIDEQQEHTRRTFTTARDNALIALTRAIDWRYLQLRETGSIATQDARGRSLYVYSSGWHKALQLCFDNTVESPSPSPLITDNTLDAWADQMLQTCASLAEGEQILAYCETGFMRMQQGGQRDFSAWIASKKMPTEWRERADIEWWTNMLARRSEYELQELAAETADVQQQLAAFAVRWQPGTPVYRITQEIDDYYIQLGILRVRGMAAHFLYPAQTVIGGCTVELYRNVLAVLIGWALKHGDVCRAFAMQHTAYTLRALLATPHDATALIEALSKTLRVDGALIRRVVDAYSLHHQNVSYHCSIAETPAPPLLCLDERRLVWSLTGLLSEPFFFLARELKRLHSSEYHTASHAHEEIFRQDLYQLFSDKRFVRSAGSVDLRDTQGKLTTDVDALIFDRKTGALALFELKSQDPFAYSRQERIRQRDYFYNAGKQVLTYEQWLKRNGAAALLARLDSKLVKRLRVQKTYIFVLGRYLAHFFDGPEFDRRAAWGTWPQVLRLLDGKPVGPEDAHPIQSLYNKLMKDAPLISSSPAIDVQRITLGDRNVYIYADFETYKNRIE